MVKDPLTGTKLPAGTLERATRSALPGPLPDILPRACDTEVSRVPVSLALALPDCEGVAGAAGCDVER